jgi:hypothetical protein
MKQLATLLVTFGLVSCALGQALPDNPGPVPMPDPAWNRLQSLVYGQPIVVDNTNGPPVHCFFAGITDAYLYCNPPGNPPGAGFRIDHASVLSVAMDAPFQPAAQPTRPERNYHPAWISSMIAGGIIVGLVATRSTDAGTATEAGFIGAGVVGLIGAPLAFLPHPQIAPPGPIYPQYGIGLRLKSPIRSRSHLTFGLRTQR